MTAIAYRDGVMAADRRTIYKNLKHPDISTDQKVFEVMLAGGEGRAVVGTAGEACPGNGYIKNWLSDHHIGALPSLDGDFVLLVAVEDGRLLLVDHHGYVADVGLPFYAIGAGAEICMGAMEMGAGAIEAVTAAVKWSPECEGPISAMWVKP